jgi:hypothetical protein
VDGQRFLVLLLDDGVTGQCERWQGSPEFRQKLSLVAALRLKEARCRDGAQRRHYRWNHLVLWPGIGPATGSLFGSAKQGGICTTLSREPPRLQPRDVCARSRRFRAARHADDEVAARETREQDETWQAGCRDSQVSRVPIPHFRRRRQYREDFFEHLYELQLLLWFAQRSELPTLLPGFTTARAPVTESANKVLAEIHLQAYRLLHRTCGNCRGAKVDALWRPILEFVSGHQPIVPIFTLNYDWTFEKLAIENADRYHLHHQRGDISNELRKGTFLRSS